MTIGQRLRAARKAERLSQEALAERSHVAIASISKLERDKGDVAVETLVHLAAALRTTVGHLLGEDADSLEAALPGWRALDAERRARIRALVADMAAVTDHRVRRAAEEEAPYATPGGRDPGFATLARVLRSLDPEARDALRRVLQQLLEPIPRPDEHGEAAAR